MTSRDRTCDRAAAVRCGLALLLFVSLAAALLEHIVIDVLGDVLLAHDTYDDVAHASRQTGVLAIGLSLLVTLSFAIAGALREARGDEGAFLALLRSVVPRSPWCHWAAVTAISLIVVAAMETCDAIAAGQPCGNVSALFGGSLLLAVATAIAVSALATGFARVALRRLVKSHRLIVALALAFIRIAVARRPFASFEPHVSRSVEMRASISGSSAGGRAPPCFPSLVFM